MHYTKLIRSHVVTTRKKHHDAEYIEATSNFHPKIISSKGRMDVVEFPVVGHF